MSELDAAFHEAMTLRAWPCVGTHSLGEGLCQNLAALVQMDDHLRLALFDELREAVTPEAPKRSLDAPSEAAHRDGWYPGGQRDASLWVEEFFKTYPNGGADADTMLGWFANAIETGVMFGRQEIEREAAHPSGAGSGLREALERIDDTIGDGGRFNGSLAMLVRIRSIAREALAATDEPGCWEDYRLGWRLGAEQERDRANQRLLLFRDRLRERIGTSDEASGIEHWHHASGGRSQPTERDGVFVDRRTVLDIIEHEAASLAIEREAAHPSGAGSGLREALERIAWPVSNGYEGDTQNREELVRWMVRTARHALAATPTVSRDGDETNDWYRQGWEAGYDAGLRVAPSAPGDSLDVALDDLRLRVRGIGNYAYTQAVLAQIDAVAELALAARLRSTGTRPEPTGATPESEG